MFDDFMHNDFSDMHLNQTHQDAMLHAQNQAMDQATRAQQEAIRTIDTKQPYITEAAQHADISCDAVNFSMLVQSVATGITNWLKHDF